MIAKKNFNLLKILTQNISRSGDPGPGPDPK